MSRLGRMAGNGASAGAAAAATGTSSHFAYDLQGRLLGEYSINAGQIRAVVEYIWLDGQPLAAVRPRVGAAADAPNSEQEVFALHSDHLGTPRVALDTDGRLRWRRMGGEPFGVNAAENKPEGLGELNLSLRLPGQQYDGFVGLHYNYFRDYDPTTGRYVQSDPIGLVGGINTYAYVSGNPLSATDPLGLLPNCRFIGLAWVCQSGPQSPPVPVDPGEPMGRSCPTDKAGLPVSQRAQTMPPLDSVNRMSSNVYKTKSIELVSGHALAMAQPIQLRQLFDATQIENALWPATK